MWPWDGTNDPATVTASDVWNYQALGYQYDPPWPGPTFTPYWLPMTPIRVNLADWVTAWGTQVFGNGWSANVVTYDPTSESLSSATNFGLIVTGPAITSTAAIYLCLRGAAAPYQHPVLNYNDSAQEWFEVWTARPSSPERGERPTSRPRYPSGPTVTAGSAARRFGHRRRHGS